MSGTSGLERAQFIRDAESALRLEPEDSDLFLAALIKRRARRELAEGVLPKTCDGLNKMLRDREQLLLEIVLAHGYHLSGKNLYLTFSA